MQSKRTLRRWTIVIGLCVLLAVGLGLSRLRLHLHLDLHSFHFGQHHHREMVYVLPHEKYLKDQVAALANNTAKVTNGQALEVLDHAKRFLYVKTQDGKTGWIEEATVATQKTADAFNTLADQYKDATEVATATAGSEARMHIHPGRSQPWLYLLEKDDDVHLLKRAIAPKVITQAMPAAISKAGSESGTGRATPGAGISSDDSDQLAQLAAPEMEDWWLVRDAAGHTGWVLARSLDVDVPDAILKLGQGERFMGVYALDTVHDEASGLPAGPNASASDVPEFAVAYAADHAGLLYDFDQVVVYTWNPRKHRYEGAYRDSGIEGFLPMFVTSEVPTVAPSKKPLGPEPVFRYKVLPADGTITVPDDADANGGIPQPSALVEKAYRLQGNRVLAVGVAVRPSEEAHPALEKKSEKKKKR